MIYAWRAWRVQSIAVQLPIPLIEPGENLADYWHRLGDMWTFYRKEVGEGKPAEVFGTQRQVALTPIVGGGTWSNDEPSTAVCMPVLATGGMAALTPFFGRDRHPGVDAPVPGCTCGLWGTIKPDLPLSYVYDSAGQGSWPFTSPMVLGVVGMWGKMIRHKHGYRAALARPVALTVVHDGLPYQQLAERYDIPVYPTVEALGTEFKIL